ncbi:hypothetical protein ABIB44_002380 [Hymenobacter sp. UYCo722]
MNLVVIEFFLLCLKSKRPGSTAARPFAGITQLKKQQLSAAVASQQVC